MDTAPRKEGDGTPHRHEPRDLGDARRGEGGFVSAGAAAVPPIVGDVSTKVVKAPTRFEAFERVDDLIWSTPPSRVRGLGQARTPRLELVGGSRGLLGVAGRRVARGAQGEVRELRAGRAEPVLGVDVQLA